VRSILDPLQRPIIAGDLHITRGNFCSVITAAWNLVVRGIVNESASRPRKSGKVVRDTTCLEASAVPQHESGHAGQPQSRIFGRVKKCKDPVDAVRLIKWTGSE
jgi:hypothetical protein